MKGQTHYLNWNEYRELAESYGINPHENQSFGIDLGGGDSEEFECVDDLPEGEEE